MKEVNKDPGVFHLKNMDKHMKAHFTGDEKVLLSERRGAPNHHKTSNNCLITIGEGFPGVTFKILWQKKEGGRCCSKNTPGSLGHDRRAEGCGRRDRPSPLCLQIKKEKNSCAICD